MINEMTLLAECNYTYIPFDGKHSTNDWIDALLWCEEYKGIGHFSMGGHGIYFENEKDAIMFTLIYK